MKQSIATLRTKVRQLTALAAYWRGRAKRAEDLVIALQAKLEERACSTL